MDNERYMAFNLARICFETLYSQYKEHCITKTCSIYNKGDMGRTTYSVNVMSSNKMAEKMAAMEERQDVL